MRVVQGLGLAGSLMLAVGAQTASAQTCLTTVTVDGSGKLADKPQTLLCHPEDKVFWIVVNEHKTSSVKVTFKNFLIRGTATPSEPLDVKEPVVNVGKEDVDVSRKVNVKKLSLVGGFKYTIIVEIGGKQTDAMDPDLDVTPPPSASGDRGRGRGRGGR